MDELLTQLRAVQETALRARYATREERTATLNMLSAVEILLRGLAPDSAYGRVKALTDAQQHVAKALRAADALFLLTDLPDVLPILAEAQARQREGR